MTFAFDVPPVVVDASAAIQLLEGDPRWVEAFDDWASSDRMVLAPVLFLAEVANAQLLGQRVPSAEVATSLERLHAAGIEVVDRGLAGVLEAVQLADKHRLTVYDALYLQIALDVDGELATLDGDLARAARTEGLTLT